MIGYRFNFSLIPKAVHDPAVANAFLAFVVAYQDMYGGIDQKTYDRLPDNFKVYWAAFEVSDEKPRRKKKP